MISLLLTLIACAPDRYSEAQAACARSEADCEAAVAADLGVVQDDDPEVYAAAVAAGRILVTWDLGAWKPAESGYVHDDYYRILDGYPGETTTARVYNLVAYEVESVGRLEPGMTVDGATGAFYEHTVYLSGLSLAFRAEGLAGMFAHEAAHGVVPGHDDCGGYRCDRSWYSAYGFEAATMDLAWAHDPNMGIYYTSMEQAAERVEVE